MLERGKMDRGIVEIVDTESLVPKDHLLRKIDAAVDFNRLYEMVEPLYSEDNGRPSVDPVVLFKMVLIQHLYGLPSLRRTADEISANICYRWFLGYTLQEETPHFSTVSYNFRHRFTAETVDQVFAWILEEVAEAGYLSPKAVFIDGTHIKANANTKKQIKEQVPVASKHYAKELMAEVNADREAHGKKPFDEDNDEPPTAPKKRKDNTSRKKLARRKKEKTRIVTQSVTDPDCGLFVKGEHKRQFAYEAHTACDSHGFVLETVVTPGNVHDSVAFDEVYDKVTKTFPETETIVADSAYKTPHICKKVFDDGRVLSTAYKRPQTMKGGHEWWKYVYDEFYDCVICPEYQILKYATTNRDGYREYKSDPKICTNCPSRELCTHSKDCVKTVQRHIWKDYEELADEVFYTFEQNGTSPTAEEFRNAFNLKLGKIEEKGKSLYEYYDEFIIKERKEKSWTDSTYRKHRTVKKHIQNFAPNLGFSDLTEDGLNKLTDYMLSITDDTGNPSLKNTTIKCK